MSTTTRFDLGRLTKGIETRDAGEQLALYAPDATVTVADPNDQPRSPRVLRGREQIGPWLEDIYGREMSHSVGNIVQDDDGAAFTVRCSYPDGTNVLCATVLSTADGMVVEQTIVQVWDEQ
jgi:hypothetical protein